MATKLGQIKPPATMLLRQSIGEAEGGGFHFEMSMVNMHTPCVRCVETGKFFILPWADIIDLAEQAGVTE